MKKKMTKLLALALAATFALTACNTGGQTTEPAPSEGGEPAETTTSEGESTAETTSETAEHEPITDLYMSQTVVNEMETFNMLYSQSQKEFDVLCNNWDGLLEVDTHGVPIAGIAEDWGSEDGGLTWTFNLREGVKWVDVNAEEKDDCTAWDFASGLEWVLNFHKNDSANTSMPLEMIEGANEYYEYTKTLSKEEAYALTAGEGSTFLEMVGVEVPDDYTIVYHCINPKPYFDSVATYACLFPISQAMVDELGGPDGVRAMNNETMWYNGPYLMTSYIQGNEKIQSKNPKYWDTECTLFDTVTIKMVESTDIAFQLYQAGELDYVALTESNLTTIYNDENNEFHDYLVEKLPTKYSWQIHFNFAKNNEDGTPDNNWNLAVANEAFRLSWYYGLDLKEYYSRLNAINPMSCENNAYTMKGLVYTSDGTDYADLVKEELGIQENGETLARLDADKAEQYKQQAIEELTAAGVTFPIGIDYYISASNQTALDSANVFKQCFIDSFGEDYVQLNIKTYVSSATQEVYTPRLHSIALTGWGADYGDPQNYLGQETYGNDNAYFSASYNYINEVEANENTQNLIDTFVTFTEMVEAADAIHDDLDARYQAYAEAEAYMIQHAICIPNYYDVGWCLSKINLYSQRNAMFGCQNNKMKNWETSVDGYTTEEMEAFKQAYLAE